MKTVFTANKSSYGSEFTQTFNSLEELKKGIVDHEHYFDDEEDTPEYSEELFEKASKSYSLYKIELHKDEKVVFGDYDGQSWFHIEKKDPNILSKAVRI